MDEIKEMGWLTIREASDESGYAEEYIRKLIRDGDVSAIKKGVAYFVNKQSLMDYKDKKTNVN